MAKENAHIKQQLECANAQLTTLKEKISKQIDQCVDNINENKDDLIDDEDIDDGDFLEDGRNGELKSLKIK